MTSAVELILVCAETLRAHIPGPLCVRLGGGRGGASEAGTMSLYAISTAQSVSRPRWNDDWSVATAAKHAVPRLLLSEPTVSGCIADSTGLVWLAVAQVEGRAGLDSRTAQQRV